MEYIHLHSVLSVSFTTSPLSAQCNKDPLTKPIMGHRVCGRIPLLSPTISRTAIAGLFANYLSVIGNIDPSCDRVC